MTSTMAASISSWKAEALGFPLWSGSPALLVQLRTWRTQVTVWHDTCFWHLRVNSIVSHASSEGPGQKAVSSQGDPSFHSAAHAPKVRESHNCSAAYRTGRLTSLRLGSIAPVR